MDAPLDPRALREEVRVGVIEKVGEGAVRILAPNPSPMTLDGTNSYLLFDGESASGVVVDPGPNVVAHHLRIEGAAKQAGVRISAVVVTHGHIDHSESAFEVAKRWNVPVFGHRLLEPLGVRQLKLDARCVIGGVDLEVLSTPGHSGDHISLLDRYSNLLSGDHILGRGTTFVAYPEGKLDEYLDSLARVIGMEFTNILPGHGPVLYDGVGHDVVRYYWNHRRYRLFQIIGILHGLEKLSISQIVNAIYGQLMAELKQAAVSTTMAALLYLEDLDLLKIAGEEIRLTSISLDDALQRLPQ